MKIRVIYNSEKIISADKPDGAAALDFETNNMIINEHNEVLEYLYNQGYDVSVVSEMVMQEGEIVSKVKWLHKTTE